MCEPVLDYYMGIGPWERDDVICWETTPRLGRGSQPADLIPAGVWPKDGAA